MSGQPGAIDRPQWQRLLTLGEQLMAQPTVASQRQLILETTTQLTAGEAELWLSEALRRLPDAEELSFPAEPPSLLMRRAVEARRPVSGTGGEPGEALAVAIPLLAQGETLGALEVERPDGRPFSDDEIAQLEGLAAQSAVALQAAHQVAIERWRSEQLALVRTVSAQVADVLDLDELARRVTDLILRTFNYYYVALFTLEPGQEILLCRASAGPRRCESLGGEALSALSVRLGQGIVGHVAQTGEELVADDVSREPRYRYVDVLPETGSEAALPLKIEDRVLGVLDVQSDRPERFEETDMLVLRALADQIAIAVEDARLYSDLRRRADQLSGVAEVGRAVTSILDLDHLLDEVVVLIHEQFGYPFVHLFTVDPARGQIVHRAGIGPSGEMLPDGGPICSLDEPEGVVPWVACHGETVLANDVQNDPRYRPSLLPPSDTRAQLAVPLTFGGEVLGVLDVQSDHQDAFSEEDRFVFEALADSVAIAIRNANLYRSERWRRQVAESMQDVAGLLSAGVDLEQMLDAILTELERNLPCDAAAIWLLRDEELCLSAVHGYPARVCVSDVLSGADPWLRRALHADRPIVRTPDSPPDPLGDAMGFPPDYSAIAAPLRAGDQPLGVLTLAHHDSERYGVESRAMTAAFASYAAVAIENARLYQETEELARISTVMLQVAEATRSLSTPDEVLETIVHLVPVLTGVERCAILLWDENVSAFLPAAAYGLAPEEQAAFDRWSIAPGDELAFDALQLDKEPLFIYDVATDDRLSGSTAWSIGFESLLLLPLVAQGEVLGVMLLDYRGDWLEFSTVGAIHEEQLVIIQGIALQTAAAIENTKLREAQREEAYVSAALLQVAQAVASLSDLDDTLATIVRLTPMLVGVDRCLVFLRDDEGAALQVAQAYGFSRDVEADLLSRQYALGDFPLLEAVRARDAKMLLEDRDEWDEWVPSDLLTEFLPGDGSGSLLGVPLSMKGDVLGVMLVRDSASGRFSERRLEIITGIAQQMALAVQNDRLQQEMAERQRLERELQLAREIQQTFMPRKLPHLPGWELAVTWRAARQVAGDFYDVFELSDGYLGLVVADVADKGMPAALFMALTRTLMRAAALEEQSPAGALARVNNLLVPDAQHGMFVTAVYAVLSLKTGEVAFANAGHHPPLVLRSGTGEIEQFDKGEMALGVLEGVRFEEKVVGLGPGDYVILYTDGVTEAFSPEGEMYGEEYLREIIRDVAEGSAQAMLDAILDSVAAFIGDRPPSDDLTIAVLRRSM